MLCGRLKETCCLHPALNIEAEISSRCWNTHQRTPEVRKPNTLRTDKSRKQLFAFTDFEGAVPFLKNQRAEAVESGRSLIFIPAFILAHVQCNNITPQNLEPPVIPFTSVILFAFPTSTSCAPSLEIAVLYYI